MIISYEDEKLNRGFNLFYRQISCAQEETEEDALGKKKLTFWRRQAIQETQE